MMRGFFWLLMLLVLPSASALMPFWNMTDSNLLFYLGMDDDVNDYYFHIFDYSRPGIASLYYTNGSYINMSDGVVFDGVQINETGRLSSYPGVGEYELENFSVCFWFYYMDYTPETNTKKYNIFTVNDLPTGIQEINFYFQNSTGKNQLHFDVNYDFDLDLFPDAWILLKDNQTGLSEGAWTHICGIKEGSYTYLYFDMINLTNVTRGASGDIDGVQNFTKVIIGGSPGTHDSFNGRVDEISMWDRALSESEVLDVYNEGWGWTWMEDTSFSESYDSSAYVGYSSVFNLTVYHDPVVDVNATLFWNSSGLSATASTGSYNSSHAMSSFVVSHVGPSISGLSEDFEFYWNVTFDYEWQPDNTYLMSAHNQTVYSFQLDDCSNGSVVVANFSFWEEDYPGDNISVDAEIVVTYWYENSSLTQVFNSSWDDQDNYQLCIEPNVNLSADVYIKHVFTGVNPQDDDSVVHRFYLFNQTFDNVTDQFYLYNYNHSMENLSIVQLTTRYESNYNFYPDVLGKLLRYYPSENLWRTVQYSLSDDFGLLIYEVVERHEDYKLIFTDTSNRVLKTTASLKFLCDAGVCSNIVLLSPYDGGESGDDLSVGYTFDNASKMLNISWVNSVGGTSTINYRVTQEKMGSQVDLCSGSQTGSSGVASCNLTGVEGVVYVSVDGDDELKLGEFLSIATEKLFDVLSKAESAFWSFGLMLTIIMTGLLSPAIVVVTTLFGLIFIFFLGSFSAFSYAFIIVAGAMGVVIALKVKS